jgi:hypothetical protein
MLFYWYLKKVLVKYINNSFVHCAIGKKIIVFTFYKYVVRTRAIPVAPTSAQPAIIFRLEMAQPLYVIARVACAASSRVFAAKYRHRGGMQLYLIIACFHWTPSYVSATVISCCSFFRKCPDMTKLKRSCWADYRMPGEHFPLRPRTA